MKIVHSATMCSGRLQIRMALLREEERAGNGGKDYIFLIEFGRYIVVVVESDEYAS